MPTEFKPLCDAEYSNNPSAIKGFIKDLSNKILNFQEILDKPECKNMPEGAMLELWSFMKDLYECPMVVKHKDYSARPRPYANYLYKMVRATNPTSFKPNGSVMPHEYIMCKGCSSLLKNTPRNIKNHLTKTTKCPHHSKGLKVADACVNPKFGSVWATHLRMNAREMCWGEYFKAKVEEEANEDDSITIKKERVNQNVYAMLIQRVFRRFIIKKYYKYETKTFNIKNNQQQIIKYKTFSLYRHYDKDNILGKMRHRRTATISDFDKSYFVKDKHTYRTSMGATDRRTNILYCWYGEDHGFHFIDYKEIYDGEEKLSYVYGEENPHKYPYTSIIDINRIHT